MTYKENITAILECYFTGFKKEIIDSACNRILEQEPKADWIPVSEKLPEPHKSGKTFLVTDTSGKVHFSKFYIPLSNSDITRPYWSGMIDVVAWMPFTLDPFDPQESEDKNE